MRTYRRIPVWNQGREKEKEEGGRREKRKPISSRSKSLTRNSIKPTGCQKIPRVILPVDDRGQSIDFGAKEKKEAEKERRGER